VKIGKTGEVVVSMEKIERPVERVVEKRKVIEDEEVIS
jgi:hypothetical protein